MPGMARVRSAWLVSLPLVAAGSLAAHQLAYRITAGDHADAALRASGHAYLAHLPAGAMLGVVCLVLGLILAAVDRGGRAAPAWVIGLLPLIGFACQEHLERLAEHGAFPWHAAAEPTFLLGLLLQLPFAAVAFLLARWLLRVVAAIIGAGRDRQARRAPRLQAPATAIVVRATGLARRLAPRGPPSALSV